ncbi:hypothetical protein HPB50_001357 [Hyalomma asiaticum]|uniref:Uncharacterized protein n=1 Tax=Hyalomma asiaticum TaxID=266040 RepID=A0ACB7RRJ9_HYAAI|nr:hypothetical protein HPB50_001357 [Hyalomma asiaticum]
MENLFRQEACQRRSQMHPSSGICRNRTRPRPTLRYTSVADTPELHPSVFFLTDRDSCLRFLSNTSVKVSVLPFATKGRRVARASSLRGANNTTVTYEHGSLPGFNRRFRWISILAKGKFAIVGRGFLRHFGALVDVGNRRFQEPV